MTKETASNSEERLGYLFQPDTLLSADYYDSQRKRSKLDPEKRLVLAVLEDAVLCFQDYLLARDGKRQRLFQETEQWILRHDDDWVFSFENVCEVLGIDPDYLREGLLRWKKNKLAECSKAKAWTEDVRLAG